MNPITKLRSLLKKKTFAQDVANRTLMGWSPSGSAYTHYKHNDYENAYGSIRAIANRFMAIRPYTVNEKGERVDSVIKDKLYHPNQTMSSVDFREALAVMCLVHSEPLVLVWTNDGGEVKMGGNITPDNIAGFTFLENANKNITNGKTTYMVAGRTFTDKEVINLRSVNPYDLTYGFSTAQAAKRWTRLDDYIADYQKGFFENGAVPAGEFVIRTRTAQEFNDIVRGLQDKHRGAGKNNNVTYVHDPIDPSTNKPIGATIEWIPFSTTNKDLDLKTIFENVNKKIDSAYGVPATIRGVNDSVTYASAQVDEKNFVMNVVEPFTMKVWTKFTHELNRITGGTGVAVVFDLDIPQVADEEKVKAETENITLQMIINAKTAGFTLPSIIKALDLEKRYENLEIEVVEDHKEDNADVDTTETVEDSPNPELIDTGYSKSSKEMTEEQRLTYEQQITIVAKRLMEQQVDRAVNTSKSVGTATQDELDEFAKDMTRIATGIMLVQGIEEYQKGINLLLEAGFSAPEARYIVSETAIQRYTSYVRNVGQSYSSDTTQAIREILKESQAQGLTRQQTQLQLRNIMQTDEWRVTRLAVSETNRAGSIASLDSMEQIQRITGTRLYKVWNTSSLDPCEYCQALNKTRVEINNPFVLLNETVRGVDGGEITNNFTTMEVTQMHPNCHCYMTYEVVPQSKAVNMETSEIRCTECDRFLGKAKGEMNAIIKCSNSKCKHDNLVYILNDKGKVVNKSKDMKQLKSKVKELEDYSKELESIIDGQG